MQPGRQYKQKILTNLKNDQHIVRGIDKDSPEYKALMANPSFANDIYNDKDITPQVFQDFLRENPSLTISDDFVLKLIKAGKKEYFSAILENDKVNLALEVKTQLKKGKPSLNLAEYAINHGAADMAREILGFSAQKETPLTIADDLPQRLKFKQYRKDAAALVKENPEALSFNYACKRGNVDQVKQSLAEIGETQKDQVKAININAKIDEKDSLLSRAVKEGELEVAKLLVEAGASPEYRGAPRFILAGKNKNILDEQIKLAKGGDKDAKKACEELVNAGIKLSNSQYEHFRTEYGLDAKVNKRFSDSQNDLSALFAEAGEEAGAFRKMLNKNKNAFQKQISINRLTAHVAVDAGRASIVKHIISNSNYGAFIALDRSVDKAGKSLTHKAIESGDVGLVKFLAQKLATSNRNFAVMDKNGENIFHAAAKQNNPDLFLDVLQMAQNHEKNKKFYQASYIEDAFTAKDKHGRAALDYLVQAPPSGTIADKQKMLEALSKQIDLSNIDVNIRAAKGGKINLLNIAIERGDKDIAVALAGIVGNADMGAVAAPDNVKNKALDLCVSMFSPENYVRTATIMSALANNGAEFSEASLRKIVKKDVGDAELMKVAFMHMSKEDIQSTLREPSISLKNIGLSGKKQPVKGPSILQDLIDRGDVAKLDALFKALDTRGVDLDNLTVSPLGARSKEPMPILTYAVMKGQEHVVRNMLNNGLDPNISNSKIMKGDTPLMTALRGINDGINHKNATVVTGITRYMPGASSNRLSAAKYENVARALLENETVLESLNEGNLKNLAGKLYVSDAGSLVKKLAKAENVGETFNKERSGLEARLQKSYEKSFKDGNYNDIKAGLIDRPDIVKKAFKSEVAEASLLKLAEKGKYKEMAGIYKLIDKANQANQAEAKANKADKKSDLIVIPKSVRKNMLDNFRVKMSKSSPAAAEEMLQDFKGTAFASQLANSFALDGKLLSVKAFDQGQYALVEAMLDSGADLNLAEIKLKGGETLLVNTILDQIVSDDLSKAEGAKGQLVKRIDKMVNDHVEAVRDRQAGPSAKKTAAITDKQQAFVQEAIKDDNILRVKQSFAKYSLFSQEEKARELLDLAIEEGKDLIVEFFLEQAVKPSKDKDVSQLREETQGLLRAVMEEQVAANVIGRSNGKNIVVMPAVAEKALRQAIEDGNLQAVKGSFAKYSLASQKEKAEELLELAMLQVDQDSIVEFFLEQGVSPAQGTNLNNPFYNVNSATLELLQKAMDAQKGEGVPEMLPSLEELEDVRSLGGNRDLKRSNSTDRTAELSGMSSEIGKISSSVSQADGLKQNDNERVKSDAVKKKAVAALQSAKQEQSDLNPDHDDQAKVHATLKSANASELFSKLSGANGGLKNDFVEIDVRSEISFDNQEVTDRTEPPVDPRKLANVKDSQGLGKS